MKIVFFIFSLIAAVYGGGSQCKLWLEKLKNNQIFCFSDDVCSLKPSWNNCQVETTQYGFTFNGATGACEALIFTGCEPSGNFFNRLAECESICLEGDVKLGAPY